MWLKPPTELKWYGRRTVWSPLLPLDSRAHSRCAVVAGSARRM